MKLEGGFTAALNSYKHASKLEFPIFAKTSISFSFLITLRYARYKS